MAPRAELISGATVVNDDTVVPGGWVVVTDGIVLEVGTADNRPPAADIRTSLPGMALLPGFVDIHVHGGGGASFGADLGATERAARFHLLAGTTSVLAGISTCPAPRLLEQVRAIGSLPEDLDGGGRLLGLHLEGPYISTTVRRGAHDPAIIRRPDPDELRGLTQSAPGRVRLLTAAPELDGFADVARVAVAAGTKVAAGHTDASGEQLMASTRHGVGSLTHTFNGMRPSLHRDPGPLQVVMESDVACELICDGIHVHPTFVRILRQLAGARRVVLITDAVAWAGLPDGDHQSANRHVEVRQGRVVLAGTDILAGSTLTMAGAVKRYSRVTGAGLPELAAASSANAARLLGEDHRLGRLAPGYAADLVVLDRQMDCIGVMARGRWVKRPGSEPVKPRLDADAEVAECPCTPGDRH